MKRLIWFIIFMFACSVSYATQWRGGAGEDSLLGTELVNDIDVRSFEDIVDPLDRMLQDYREGQQLKFNTVAQVTVTAGQVMVENSAGTIRLMLSNSSDTTVTWADIDVGAEANNTYYVYAIAAASSSTSATYKISLSSTAPTGPTYYYYKRLGSFVNSSGDITTVKNDDERMIVKAGTVADTGTIPLPSGWLQDECNWTVGVGSVLGYDGLETSSLQQIRYTTTTSSRVVVCDFKDQGGTSTAGTCNYIIACYR